MKGSFCLIIAFLMFICVPSVDAQNAQGSSKYTEWSTPVNLGPSINSAANDVSANLSRDGRSLYFSSTRLGGWGGEDIWVSHRNSRKDDWGTPINLGPIINSTGLDRMRYLSPDGHFLLIQGDRLLGGFGGSDIWVSH